MKNVIGVISANYSSDGLGVLTENRTVASLPFGGRYRLIDFPLSNMINAGINTVGIVMPYKYRSIIDHIGAGKEWGLDRKRGGLYVLPGSVFGLNSREHKFLIRDMRRNIVFLKRSERSYVLYTGSSIVNNMDYEAIVKQHIDTGADVTMVVKECDHKNMYLREVEVSGGRVRSIRTGVKAKGLAFNECFVINHDILMKLFEWYMAVDYMDLFDAIAGDLDKINVRIYEYGGYSRSIHRTGSYFKYSMELLNSDVRKHLFAKDRPITTKIQDTVPTKYGAGCVVSNSLIPAGGNILGTVKNSILFRGVTVEEGAEVINSIIMQKCVIRKGARVENAILDRYNIIGSGTMIKGTEDDIFVMDKKNIW